MNLFTRLSVGKPLKKNNKYFFKRSFYVVDYKINPDYPFSIERIIVVDEVPGKLARLFGSKTKRRVFAGRNRWFEIVGNNRIKCSPRLSRILSIKSINLEKKFKYKLKMEKRNSSASYK